MAEQKFFAEDDEKMKALRAEGLSWNKIADRFNTTPATVKRRCGYEPENPKGPRRSVMSSTDETVQMWTDYVGGMSYPKLSMKYGISQGSVHKRLQRHIRTMPESPRDVMARRESDLIDVIRAPLLKILLDEEAFHTSADRINAARAVLSTMERLSKAHGLDASDALNERRVAIQERQAEMVAQAMVMFAQLLGLDPQSPRIRQHMQTALEGVQVDNQEEDVA